MRAYFAIVFMFSAAMLLINPVPAYGANVFVRSCDELPLEELDDAETITFVSQISCQVPKVMNVKKDLIVRSHAAIDTKNLYFNVHRGATLTIHSPGMTIARHQGSTVPLLHVSGKIIFEATGSIPELLDGSLEDKRGVVYMTYSGTVETAEEIRYVADSVIVSKMAGPGVKQGVSPRQADGINTELKHQPKDELSSSSSSSSSTPFASASTPSTSTTSNVLSFEESDTDDGVSILSFLSSYDDTPGGRGIRHSKQVDHASIETSAANEQDEIKLHTIPNAGQDAADDVKNPSENSIDDPSPILTPSSDTSSNPSTSSGSTANTHVDSSSKLNIDKPGAGTIPSASSASSSPTPPSPSPGVDSSTPGSRSTTNTYDGDGPSKLNIDKPGAGTIPSARSASSSPTLPSPSPGANSPTPGSSSTANTYGGDSPSKLNNDKPSASTMPDPATTSSSSTPPGPSPGANPPSPSNPDRSHPSPSHDNGHRYGGSRNPPSTPGSHDSPDNGGWDSDGDRSGSRDNSPKAVPGPKLALKVGEVGQPPFLSGSGNSMMWPAEDGSIIFRTTSETPADFFTGSAGKREVTTTEIVTPDSSRQKRVYKARAALMKELQEGGVSESKEDTWGAWGWVPFGRQHRRDVEAARSHLGEVTMTLDDKACVDVTIDGICVLSKSGPYKREWMNRFPWRRRKDDGYELYVTEEGIEVQLEEKKVWGVSAADMID